MTRIEKTVLRLVGFSTATKQGLDTRGFNEDMNACVVSQGWLNMDSCTNVIFL